MPAEAKNDADRQALASTQARLALLSNPILAAVLLPLDAAGHTNYPDPEGLRKTPDEFIASLSGSLKHLPLPKPRTPDEFIASFCVRGFRPGVSTADTCLKGRINQHER